MLLSDHRPPRRAPRPAPPPGAPSNLPSKGGRGPSNLPGNVAPEPPRGPSNLPGNVAPEPPRCRAIYRATSPPKSLECPSKSLGMEIDPKQCLARWIPPPLARGGGDARLDDLTHVLFIFPSICWFNWHKVRRKVFAQSQVGAFIIFVKPNQKCEGQPRKGEGQTNSDERR